MTASLACALAMVSSAMATPCASKQVPPTRSSSVSNVPMPCWFIQAISRFTSAMTSGPMPSPARKSSLWVGMRGYLGRWRTSRSATGGTRTWQLLRPCPDSQGNESRLTSSWAQYLQQVLWVPAGALAAALDGLLVGDLAHQIEGEVADHCHVFGADRKST